MHFTCEFLIFSENFKNFAKNQDENLSKHTPGNTGKFEKNSGNFPAGKFNPSSVAGDRSPCNPNFPLFYSPCEFSRNKQQDFEQIFYYH